MHAIVNRDQLLARQGGIHALCRHTVGFKLVNLIFHQRNQGRNH
ncbi:hypothetical protein DA89_2228 [Vibrio paracholerae]|nr:hypothetical protein DA89_2228 [Vibrio paracholerae]